MSFGHTPVTSLFVMPVPVNAIYGASAQTGQYHDGDYLTGFRGNRFNVSPHVDLLRGCTLPVDIALIAVVVDMHILLVRRLSFYVRLKLGGMKNNGRSELKNYKYIFACVGATALLLHGLFEASVEGATQGRCIIAPSPPQR